MREILAEVQQQAERILSDDSSAVQRSVYREATQDIGNTTVDIQQYKFITPEEMAVVRARGVKALATVEWFNDVVLRTHPDPDLSVHSTLHIGATYPVAYLAGSSSEGAYLEDREGNRYPIDQYGSVSGYGHGRGIDTWVLSFIDQSTRSITKLQCPEDPTALEQYNARYQQYLDDLNSTTPQIRYYRAWERHFAGKQDATPVVLGGLSLIGVSISEVLQGGDYVTPDYDSVDGMNILLRHEPEGRYTGTTISIADGQAVAVPFWQDDEDISDPASDELLDTTLGLLRRVG